MLKIETISADNRLFIWLCIETFNFVFLKYELQDTFKLLISGFKQLIDSIIINVLRF